MPAGSVNACLTSTGERSTSTGERIDDRPDGAAVSAYATDALIADGLISEPGHGRLDYAAPAPCKPASHAPRQHLRGSCAQLAAIADSDTCILRRAGDGPAS